MTDAERVAKSLSERTKRALIECDPEDICSGNDGGAIAFCGYHLIGSTGDEIILNAVGLAVREVLLRQ